VTSEFRRCCARIRSAAGAARHGPVANRRGLRPLIAGARGMARPDGNSRLAIGTRPLAGVAKIQQRAAVRAPPFASAKAGPVRAVRPSPRNYSGEPQPWPIPALSAPIAN
jgi:hypothetical protein